MRTPICPVCERKMNRNGTTSSGRVRWRCRGCNSSQVRRIDTAAKDLEAFLSWLLSGKTLQELPGGGRTFQRQCQPLWHYWALPPVIDEVHDVIYVDGIHLGRKAVVLIAQSDRHVLGWYVARSEKAQAWQALMERIAPPLLVVTDGGGVGLKKPGKRHGLLRVCNGVLSTHS